VDRPIAGDDRRRDRGLRLRRLRVLTVGSTGYHGTTTEQAFRDALASVEIDVLLAGQRLSVAWGELTV
jgi:hypothetical protein